MDKAIKAVPTTASAARQLSSQPGSAGSGSSAGRALLAGQRSTSSARRVGSCQAPWGSTTTWRAPASQVRSGLEVGMSPTRTTSSAALRRAKAGSRSSTS